MTATPRRSLLGLALVTLSALLPAGVRAQDRAPEGPAALFHLVMRQPERLEEALRTSFSRLLGEPSELELQVEQGTRVERLGGRFRRISVRFRDGALDTLRVRRAHLEARDVHFDLEKLLSGETFLPRSVGSTHLDLEIDEEALNEGILHSRRRLGVSDPRFSLEEGALRFRGGIRLVFFDNHIDLQGGLQVRNGSEIHFRPHRLHVSRVKVPGFLVRAISRRFNPIVRLSRAPFWDAFHVRLGEIRIAPDRLQVITEEPPAPWVEAPPVVPLIAQVENVSPGSRPREGAGSSVVRFGAL